jgi:hypothetical protein
LISNKQEEIENICYKCGRKNIVHPSTGRFGTITLIGHECAWNPDAEFKDYVIKTLQTSGYDLHVFGLLE